MQLHFAVLGSPLMKPAVSLRDRPCLEKKTNVLLYSGP